MEYLTIPDVELASVGMNWRTASGDLTLTFEHLADAMEAANEDPLIQSPRLRLGHTDPRFTDEEEQDHTHDPFYDGEPAFGAVENLRLENDGAVLVGDFVEVPEWLAESLPSAYRSRSIEGAEGNTGDASWDVETSGGKRYTFVLTAVSLLGVYRPAVEDLEDLKRLLVEGEGLVVTGGVEASAGMGDVGILPSARADHSKVIDTFYADVAVEEDGRYWWWVRALWTDPNELIVDDDEGSLWRVPFTSNDGQNVSFDDPVKVLETFVDMPSEKAAAAAASPGHKGKARKIFAEASASRPGDRKPAEKGGIAPSGTTGDMDVSSTEIRTVLDLSAEASDDEVSARLAERAAASAEGSEEPEAPESPEEPEAPEAPESPEKPEKPEKPESPEKPEKPESPEEPEAPEASATQTIDAETLAELRRKAEEGAAARAEQVGIDRERKLEAAVKAGKFPPSRRDHYRQAHKADAAGTEALIESLAPGLVPVDQRGSAADPGADAQMPAIMASFGVGTPGGDS